MTTTVQHSSQDSLTADQSPSTPPLSISDIPNQKISQPPSISDIRNQEMQTLGLLIQKELSTVEGTLLHHRLYSHNSKGKTNCSIRAYFIVKIWQSITGASFSEALTDHTLLKLVTVGEYCITLMYLDNHFFDEKFGVTTQESRAANRAERALYTQILQTYIRLHFAPTFGALVQSSVNDLFKLYDKGMHIDRELLSYESFKNNKQDLYSIDAQTDGFVDVNSLTNLLLSGLKSKHVPLQQTEYMKLYLTRAYLINGVFFQIFTDLLIQLYPKFLFPSKKGALFTFARTYGLAQQLVNDNCDYLPVGYGFSTSCKLPEDTFSDMRRRMITLPVICLLNHEDHQALDVSSLIQHYQGTSKEQDFSEDQNQQQALELLSQSGALGQSMSMLRVLASHAASSLDLTNTASPAMKDMLSFINGNRYYQEYCKRKN